MFKRKNEFKPDKTSTGTLNKLYITPKQRRSILKWLLMTAALVAVCVVQDTILSRLSVFGTTFDLMAAVLLMVCVLQDPEIGSIFVLIAALFYWFSGSAPGPYVVAMIPCIGIFFAIVRHCYLHESFGSAMLCTGASILVYEVLLFAVSLFLDYTTLSRLPECLIKAGISLAAMPLLYPVFVSIVKIGGESWND